LRTVLPRWECSVNRVPSIPGRPLVERAPVKFLAADRSHPVPLTVHHSREGGMHDKEERHMVSNPLSSAALRLEFPAGRCSVESASPARPFVLRFAQQVTPRERPEYRYSPELQIALDPDGRPLVETMDKDVRTKRHSDGDEGVEEEYDWEEL
jgi:putative ATP-grasp target RiPP